MSYTKNWPNTWPELACRADQGQLGQLGKAGDDPTAVPPHELGLLWLGLVGQLTKHPREDPSTGWSGLRRQHSYSRGKYSLKWC